MRLALLLPILSTFALLSILAVGGGTSVLPEMKAITVGQEKWLTEDQFRDIYSLGQLVPGPNMLMVIVIGYHVSGFPGALAAFFGFFVPSSVIALMVGRVWMRFEGSPWRTAIQRGFAPIVVGLMLAGMIAIARTAIDGSVTLGFASVVFVILYFGKKMNPALLILAGGIFGFLLLR